MNERDFDRMAELVRLLKLRPHDYLCTEVAALLERILKGAV